MNKFLIEAYLDYVNNYLTLELFAEHNGISLALAANIVKEGRILYEINVGGIDSLNTQNLNYFVNEMEY